MYQSEVQINNLYKIITLYIYESLYVDTLFVFYVLYEQ